MLFQLISAVGFESSPFDLLSWAMAHTIQEKYGVLTKEATMTLYDVKYVSLITSERDDIPLVLIT